MLEQLDIQSVIDIGFVGFVTLACYISLTRDSSYGDARRERWKVELKEVEQALKGLIQEASQASSSLDRSLLQRKRELEGLLKKIEEKETSCRAAWQGQSSTACVEEELPNDTWFDEPVKKTPAQNPQPTTQSASRQAGAAELEALVQAADDTVSISNSLMKPAQSSREKKVAKGVASALARQIEVVAEEEEIEKATFELTSIMDQGTYKIARRLLREGKELDIVARKLELPVSEVRLLDRLMRSERSEVREESESESADQRYHIVRDKVRRNSLGGVRAGIEDDIEREIALL